MYDQSPFAPQHVSGALQRAQDAAQNIAEALAVVQQLSPPAGAPPPNAPAGPPGGPPPGPMGGGPPSPPPMGLKPPGLPPAPAMGVGGPPPSPLQGLPSFKSPPLASYLQGSQGQSAQINKPVGFAKGGLAMAKGGAWTRKEGQNPEGGLNAKGRASLRAQGHDIKPPVSAKQAGKSPKAAARRRSFCARSAGQAAQFPAAARDPNSRLNKARRKWDC